MAPLETREFELLASSYQINRKLCSLSMALEAPSTGLQYFHSTDHPFMIIDATNEGLAGSPGMAGVLIVQRLARYCVSEGIFDV